MNEKKALSVTPESLPESWNQVDCMRLKAKRKASIAKVGGFFSNLFFF